MSTARKFAPGPLRLSGAEACLRNAGMCLVAALLFAIGGGAGSASARQADPARHPVSPTGRAAGRSRKRTAVKRACGARARRAAHGRRRRDSGAECAKAHKQAADARGGSLRLTVGRWEPQGGAAPAVNGPSGPAPAAGGSTPATGVTGSEGGSQPGSDPAEIDPFEGGSDPFETGPSSAAGSGSSEDAAGASEEGSESAVGDEPELGSGGSGSSLAAETGSELAPQSQGASGEQAGPYRFFASTSFWNEPVPADAPLDPTSTSAVNAFDAVIAREEQNKHGPWINTTSYSVPIYTVPAAQPMARVTLKPTVTAPALQAAWNEVPLPPHAQPAAGTDGALVVWQPSTDRLWEFWRLTHTSGEWEASWGGAMQNVSSDPGVYGPEAWPGAKTWWGSSASSLSIAGGLITLEDLEHGQINHALSMAVPNVRAGVFSSPAQRDDGKSTETLALPEGAHLRLDPSLDLAALHLPKLTLMIAEAAQRYGIFVRDHGGNVCFFAQDPIPTGTEPYTAKGGYFEGKYPSQLLAGFPWSHLELLKLQLHSSS